MDATKRPLRVPPEFGNYAEKHGIFDIYKRLLTELIINKPCDPLKFLLEQLKKEDDVPKIVVIGQPMSGRGSVAKMLAKKFEIAHITMESVVKEADAETRAEATCLLSEKQPLPMELWMKLVRNRLSIYDAEKSGWVMDSIPETREQALALSVEGIFPKHCVILEAPDTVLIERAPGKRIDPATGDVYHTSFDFPTDYSVGSRLQQAPNCSEAEVVEKLVLYHRYRDGIVTCYDKVHKVFNADQPKADVFSQVLTFVCSQARSAAPHTPKIILLGPVGSGKALMASMLAKKYNIVNVSMSEMLRQAIAEDTCIGRSIKPYVDKGVPVPDTFVLQILKDRLSQVDCVIRGWVLRGYPMNRLQASQLDTAKHVANRVFMLDIPNDAVIERLTLRGTDPVTGERYHMLFNPPRTLEVKQRLRAHPRDTEDSVRRRMGAYHTRREELEDFYGEIVQHVNADQDPHTVYECIESAIVNPLPKCKAEPTSDDLPRVACPKTK